MMMIDDARTALILSFRARGVRARAVVGASIYNFDNILADYARRHSPASRREFSIAAPPMRREKERIFSPLVITIIISFHADAAFSHAPFEDLLAPCVRMLLS